MRFKISPEVLAERKSAKSKTASGSRAISEQSPSYTEASKIILEKFGGNLNVVLSLPVEEARRH
jgi:hypothetical protein